MRTFLLLALLTYGLADAADEIALPKSGTISVTSSRTDQGTRYSLALHLPDGNELLLKSHDVTQGGMPPTEWFRLISCDENAEMIAALVEMNEFSLMLVQFDLATRIAKDIRVWAPKLLQDQRVKGARIQLTAPNQIVLASADGELERFSIIDSKLVGEDGASVEQGQSLQIGEAERQPKQSSLQLLETSTDAVNVPKPSALPKSPEPNTATAPRGAHRSLSWALAVVFVGVVITLVCLALTKRK